LPSHINNLLGVTFSTGVTRTPGGITRDVICGELSLIPRREIYITVAVALN
jgi:uncharacterized membrane protein YeiH